MINVALFGLGRIGQMHALNILSNKNFNLKYVYDVNSKLVKNFEKKYKIKSINNQKIAFDDKSINVIFIASSTSTHIELITKSVLAKKAVFCEKPLDLDLEKVIKCKQKISKYNAKIQLGFNRRYDPGHYALKEKLKAKIGKLKKIIITSRDPSPPPISYMKTSGGIFKDMMIHDFDLARLYLDNDKFIEITAFGTSFKNSYNSVKDYEIASVMMKSKKGVICYINNSRECTYGYDQRVEIFGEKGMMISNNERKNSIEINNSSSTNSKEPLKNFFIDRYKDAYALQLNGLKDMVLRGKKPRATFDDGHQALYLAVNAYKSLKLKKTIKL